MSPPFRARLKSGMNSSLRTTAQEKAWGKYAYLFNAYPGHKNHRYPLSFCQLSPKYLLSMVTPHDVTKASAGKVA